MRWTVNFQPKVYKTTDGTIPILIRISLNSIHDYINTGRRIKLSHYDQENNKVKPGVTGYMQYTSFIADQVSLIDDMIKEYDNQGEVITVTQIKEDYNSKTGQVKATCFFEYVTETMAWEREYSDIAPSTLDSYINTIKRLRKYVNDPLSKCNGKLSIYRINTNFCLGFFKYISEELGLADNSVYGSKIFMRKYVKKLYHKKLIKNNPFDEITVGGPHVVEIEYLELDELNALHDLYSSGILPSIWKVRSSKYAKKCNIGDAYHKIVKMFLISCYTGLRYSDVIVFCREPEKYIKKNFIVMTLKKGRKGMKKMCRIPIRKRVRDLLQPDDTYAKIKGYGASYINKLLKHVLADHLGIKRRFTFHCSRHTFAISSLMLGLKFEVVSDILCHYTYLGDH